MKIRATIIVITLLRMAISAIAKDITVSPGDSLEKARDEAKAGDRVILHGGTYRLNETLMLGPQNSGVTWMAAPGETPVISGGVPVTGWVPDKDGVWKAKLGRTDKLRQLYVNGMPAQMAQLKKKLSGGVPCGEFVVKGDEPWVLPSVISFEGKDADGISYPASAMPDVAIPSDLEVRDSHGWMDNRLCIRAMEEEGDRRILLFEQPMGAIAQKQLWNTAFNFGGPMEIFNAREFLTAPGEFYFNQRTKTLYYMPRPGEDLAKAQVVAPFLETLISIRGKNLQERASGIRFEGIAFEHTAWQLMNVAGSHGACGTQADALFVKYTDGNYHRDLYKNTDIPPAAVEVNSTDHISFAGAQFCMAGAIGLNLENDVTDSAVEGNIFRDIGSCALNIGNPEHVYIGKQIGENGDFGPPYYTDNRGDKWDETVEGLCTNIRVANNLIRRAGIEHQPSPALNIFYGHGIAIIHNDIKYAPYDGISLGWGWSMFDDRTTRSAKHPQGMPSHSLENNSICCNKIGHVLQVHGDGGAIYLLAITEPIAKDPAEQKYMEVSGNYIYEFGGWARNGIHPDDGTRYVYFHDNVFRDIGPNGNWPAPTIKVNQLSTKGNFRVEDNFSNVPMCYIEPGYTAIAHDTEFKDNIEVKDNQWPERARQDMEKAGLEPAYQSLFDQLPTVETSLDKKGWKVVSASAEGGPGGLAANAIDDNPGTLWHTLTPTAPKPPPQEIVVDMGEAHTLTGFLYLPRQDGNTTGNVSRYAFYVSADGKTWGEPAAQGEFGDIKANPVQRRVEFAKPATGRSFKFVALASADGNMIAVAELGVLASER